MLNQRDWSARYAARIATRPTTFVVQPTKFCNLDCTYCYLRDRDRRSHMPVEVARAVARSAAQLVEEDGSQPLAVVWHAGEPMALGVRRFTGLLAPFQPLLEAGLLRHYMQTNATLVTDEWCDLLLEHDFRVGVSIDGPEVLNSQRIDRRGRPAFDRIMKGIDRLRSRDIPFSALAVVSQDSIDQPELLLDFLTDLGCESIGLNIEEAEGVNTKRQPPTREQAIEFWRRTIAWSRHPAGPTVRELDRLGDYLHLVRSGQHARWEERRIDPIPTISVSGDVVLLSPELADTTAPTYEDFRAGNVLEESIPAMLDRAHRLRYVREFLTGLDECDATCAFFDFCRGAQAGNRYFENGSLATTETNYCRVSKQALVMALSDTARKEHAA
ncbi:cyclophane-forming radical SAM peptide maturase AmcB [Streptantibioticus ferralitis]|uniref:Radical SAM protein n=1 Tax=Streptantibioticus ferralitis TaxID=236510 RepID=A0ABT5Z440_9ACTN|nr:cyclophane-forming radical SAM peptide maturase AmcB [Streptantibioticus ferralitis]MDF2258596.1 radical SAM protein [Streptantibioticus ferralitis]